MTQEMEFETDEKGRVYLQKDLLLEQIFLARSLGRLFMVLVMAICLFAASYFASEYFEIAQCAPLASGTRIRSMLAIQAGGAVFWMLGLLYFLSRRGVGEGRFMYTKVRKDDDIYHRLNHDRTVFAMVVFVFLATSLVPWLGGCFGSK